MLGKSWRDAIRQIRRDVIEQSGPEMSNPHEDLEVGHREAVVGELMSAMLLEPVLQVGEEEGK